MNIRNSLVALALPAMLLSHGPAAATTNGKAIEACTGAIAKQIESHQGREPRMRIEQDTAGMRARLVSTTVFELDAFDPTSNDVVGRFTCMVNERAKVRRLRTLPLDAPDAKTRGRG